MAEQSRIEKSRIEGAPRIDCGQISILDSQSVMAFIFEKLDVYRKAVELADRVGQLTRDFPKGNYYLADQLNRAALSISTNIAEGNGRYHKADRINFFRIARGSAFECVPILEVCSRRRLISEDTRSEIRGELEDICKMLSGLISY